MGRMPASGALELDLLIPHPAWHRAIRDVEATCRRSAAAAFAAVWRDPRPAEASLLLTDDAQVRALNRDYRGRDEPTNVLAFAALEGGHLLTGGDLDGPVVLGDVVIAQETVLAEAARDAKSPSDHLSHLVVHGILHLLGYDHQGEEDAVTMEALEVRILAALGVDDPYAADSDI
jgi:metalloprotein, YbeY/UPF0054 family